MRVANLNGRLVLLGGDRALDVATASSGAFGPDPQTAYVSWESFAEWARGADFAQAFPFDAAQLGPPVPAPSQVIAIGLTTASTRSSPTSPFPTRLWCSASSRPA